MNIKEALQYGVKELENVETPLLDSQLLLAKATGLTRIKVTVEFDREVQPEEEERYISYISDRKKGRPIAYILKVQEFMGLDFHVEEGVLIPRPDTEILVEECISYLKKIGKSKFIDIGTGSGAITVSLAKLVDDTEGTSLDISETALEVGKKNAKLQEVDQKILFLKSDVFSAIEKDESYMESIDLVVSNPPYIPKEVIEGLQVEVRDFEPRLALDGGIDGLDFYRKIVIEGVKFLKKGGLMAFEVGHDQAEEVKNLMERSSVFTDIKIIKDLSGISRVVTGIKI